MIDVISVDNMRKSDAYTIENYISSLELMRRAAQGIYEAYEYPDNYISIVVGSGNNGGDGYALARILHDSGRQVTIFQVSSKTSPDSAYYMNLCVEANIPVLPYETGCLEGSNVIVDCLLGTGFRGLPRDNYIQAINEINSLGSKGSYVISADINSGLNGDTGEYEVAVRSDLTVTIGFVKRGLLNSPIIGKITVVDIGIILLSPEDKIDEEKWEITVITSH